MSFFIILYFSFLLFLFYVASSRQPFCHDSERSALLRFKESLSINKSISLDPSAYCKTELWNLEEDGDCCLWDGIECNEDTGYVIELDLGSSCLYGPINSTSTLFNLVHLQWLSLVDNDFHLSKIPSEIKNLSKLSHLNLSWSAFSGQIPSEILELSKLESLALDRNNDLELQQPGLESLVQKLTNLRVLDLDVVNISSSLPHVLSDLSSLNFLSLAYCNLKGQIPLEMLELSQLEYLDLSGNSDLQLQQPGGLRSPVDKLTNLKWLHLDGINISSSIPTSLGNLSSLTHLSLRGCNLQGQIPLEMLELSQLEYLDLSGNSDLQLRQPGGLRSPVDKLTNLKWLHLDGINISSSIPTSLGNLSSLTNLSLCGCNLQGQIPLEMLELSQLEYLDLSGNSDLQLRQPGGLRSLVDKLTNLKWLDLTKVNISSSIPTSLGNLSSLTYLSLRECNLQGTILWSLGNLNNLTHLDLSDNKFQGIIPSSLNNLANLVYLDMSNCYSGQQDPSSLGNLTLLNYLDLSFNNFSRPSSSLSWSWIGKNTKLAHLGISGINIDEFPFWLRNLTHLTYLAMSHNQLASAIPFWLMNLNKLLTLVLSYNQLSGHIPSQISNLTQLNDLDLVSNRLCGHIPSQISNLTQLNDLYLSSNQLSGFIPSQISNLTQLNELYLSYNQLSGHIPSQISNLTQLKNLDLSYNQLSGHIPSQISNLTQLKFLSLSSNKLQGSIPNSIFELNNLEKLSLSSNNLSGTIELQMFLRLKSLSALAISSNHFSLLTNITVNTSSNKFTYLSLGSCNLRSFPDFLRNQNQLSNLDLSSNNIFGKIPGWLFGISKYSLQYLNLSHNLLTGFDQQPFVLPWTSSLYYLDLSFNKLQGPLPISPIPAAIGVYLVSNNNLSGELSPWICEHDSLIALDLSNNSLSGELPQCLGTFSHWLSMLNLQNNKFHGSIPETFMDGTELRMIDLSSNMLQGKIPRSLANCTMLEFLDLGNNNISDTFPSWIGNLPNLVVLNLQSNKLYGAIEEPKSDFEFPKLQVIDLSHNRFTGKLPSKYFACWNAMKVVNASNLTYMMKTPSDDNFYDYSLGMVNKGTEIEYEKISNMLVSISLSNNRFEGEIPASVSILQGLRYLNLSNNNLVGGIPSSLDNLTVLESLDLSNNNLSGEIPQQLVEITFLEVFDVSHNHLTGPIPFGKQFDTFENSSYDGNPGLCGKPLSKECEHFEPPKKEDEGFAESPFVFDWKLCLIGFSSGLIVGVALGQEFYTRKHEWFLKTFGIQVTKRKRGRRN